MSNRILKDAMALTLITLVAGAALGGTYEITKEPIARQEALAKEKATGMFLKRQVNLRMWKLQEGWKRQSTRNWIGKAVGRRR